MPRSSPNNLVRDPILFVGGPWRATADLVRWRVFTMVYRSPPSPFTMWRYRPGHWATLKKHPQFFFNVIQVEYVCTNPNPWIVICRDVEYRDHKNSKKTGHQCQCPNMTLRSEINAGEGGLFVKASSTIVCVRSWMSLTILALTNWRTKYRRIIIVVVSMCRGRGFTLIYRSIFGKEIGLSKLNLSNISIVRKWIRPKGAFYISYKYIYIGLCWQ